MSDALLATTLLTQMCDYTLKGNTICGRMQSYNGDLLRWTKKDLRPYGVGFLHGFITVLLKHSLKVKAVRE